MKNLIFLFENSEPIYYFSKMNGIKSDNTERRKQTESMKFNIRTKFDAMDVWLINKLARSAVPL